MRKMKGFKFIHIVTASMTMLVLVSTILFQSVNAQGPPSNGTTGGPATNVTVAGNKTTIIMGGSNATSPSATTTAPSSPTSSNMTGFTKASNLMINGKTFPIKYNITSGKLLALVPDNDKATLVAVMSPGETGKMVFTIELPRNVIDSKGQGNTDTKFVVKIDHKDVDYKQVANNLNARILGIDFSKGDRIIEITGTQMRP
ncbi:MAG: hypothetical protein AUI60_00895 [Thaumarchaeota archaeon 13_1_40CM_2_39_4]|nr:MAG: hypothetical protein AUI60_00895 [Thaumarchaeota archaeon 13_1_40CM_2_39_4]